MAKINAKIWINIKPLGFLKLSKKRVIYKLKIKKKKKKKLVYLTSEYNKPIALL